MTSSEPEPTPPMQEALNRLAEVEQDGERSRPSWRNVDGSIRYLRIAHEFMQAFRLSMYEGEKVIYIFNPLTGYYVNNGESLIKQFTTAVMGYFYAPSHGENVCETIRTLCSKNRRDLPKYPERVLIKDGYFDLISGKFVPLIHNGLDQFEFKSKAELAREELRRRKGLPENTPMWNFEKVKSKNGTLVTIVATCNFCGTSFSGTPSDLRSLEANQLKHVKDGCL